MNFLQQFQDDSGRFRKGAHWRTGKPHWNKEWLVEEYVNKQRSAADIATEMNVTENAILFWLKKHNIPTRSMSEVRAIKHWGAKGSANPMFGRRGPSNPNWRGGSTPERQAFYSTIEWRAVSRKAKRRDKYTCQRCKRHKNELDCQLELHHIEPFSVVEKRADINNLVLLCEACHDFVHSKENVGRIFLLGGNK